MISMVTCRVGLMCQMALLFVGAGLAMKLILKPKRTKFLFLYFFNRDQVARLKENPVPMTCYSPELSFSEDFLFRKVFSSILSHDFLAKKLEKR